MAPSSSFSDKLVSWLSSKQKKTLASLGETFAEKSFAIALLLLLLPSGLPLPTGGVTTVFEIIAMFLSVQLIIGRRTIWLPKRWKNFKIGNFTQKKAIPQIVRLLRWTDKLPHHKAPDLFSNSVFLSFNGLIFLIFTVGSFVAPPFSGLDTLPAFGVVLLAISIMTEDMITYMLGFAVGSIGVILSASAFTIVYNLIF